MSTEQGDKDNKDYAYIPTRLLLQLVLHKAQRFESRTAHEEYLPFREVEEKFAKYLQSLDTDEILIHVEPPDGVRATWWRVYQAAWWREDNRRLSKLKDEDDTIRKHVQNRDEKICEIYAKIVEERCLDYTEETRKVAVGEAVSIVMNGLVHACKLMYGVDISMLPPEVLKIDHIPNMLDRFRKLWDKD